MAQTGTYTIYVPEQLTGKTKVVLPFKDAYNVKTFTIKTEAGVVISKNSEDTHNITVSNSDKQADGSFSSVTPGFTDHIIFDLEGLGNISLPNGDYDFTIVMFSADNCESATIPFRVHVAEKPVIELMNPTTVCQGGTGNVSVTAKSFTPNSGANVVLKYKWTAVQTSGSGLTFNSGNAATEYTYTSGNALVTDNVTNSSKSPAVITYTVTPIAEYTFGGKTVISVGEPETVEVTVNPLLDITVNPIAQTVGCGTATSIAMSTQNTDGTNDWSWTIKSKTPTIGGEAAGSGASIAQALTNSGAVEGTITYEVKHLYTNNGVTCESTTQDVIVTVLPTVNLNVGTEGRTVCTGGTTNVALTTTNNGTGSHTYTWQLEGTLPVGVTAIAGAGITENGGVYTGVLTGTSSVLAMTLTNSTAKAENLSFKVTHTYLLNGISCEAVETVVLTVNPTINVNADNQTICSAGTTNVAMTTTNTGDAASSKFTWKLKDAGLPANITLGALPSGVTVSNGVYSNADNKTLAMNLTNSGTAAINVVYVVTHEFTNKGVSCSVEKEVVITVNPTIEIKLDAGLPVCSEIEKTVAFTTTNNVNDITYSWSFTYNEEEIAVVGDNVTVSGGKATGTGDFKVVLTNKKNDQKTITVEVKAVYNGTECNATAVFSVVVNPKPSFNLGE